MPKAFGSSKLAKNTESEVGMKDWSVFVNLRKLYHWVLHWSDHKHNTKALSAIAFLESSIFPIPPDILLITMGASKPKNSIRYALYCSLASVAGGMFGYWLGHELWTLVEQYLIGGIIKLEHFELVKTKFTENAFLAIFIASFTPVPYKVFTITAGAVALPLAPFVIASVIGRSGRFFLISLLLYFYGEKMRQILERDFEKYTLTFGLLLVLLVYIIKVA